MLSFSDWGTVTSFFCKLDYLLYLPKLHVRAVYLNALRCGTGVSPVETQLYTRRQEN